MRTEKRGAACNQSLKQNNTLSTDNQPRAMINTAFGQTRTQPARAATSQVYTVATAQPYAFLTGAAFEAHQRHQQAHKSGQNWLLKASTRDHSPVGGIGPGPWILQQEQEPSFAFSYPTGAIARKSQARLESSPERSTPVRRYRQHSASSAGRSSTHKDSFAGNFTPVGTLNGYPYSAGSHRSTPFGTLRGYPYVELQNVDSRTGTLRLHQQQLPASEVLLVEEPQRPVILRGPKNIDMAISNFHIKFDSKEKFKPGDELSGKVIMDVWSHVQIRFVEFIIKGQGTVRVFKDSSTFLDQPRNETYLHKNIILIGPQKSSSHGVTLTPGRYVSSFRYNLPTQLPPTVHQFDMGHGHVFDISYSVQAHVCDKMRSKHQSGTPGAKMVRVVKATKKTFTVTAEQDWQSLPGATEPIVHGERLQLFMSRSQEPTTVLYNLNRGVFPLGDKIKLSLEVFHPKKRKVKNVEAELEQEMRLSQDAIRRFRRSLIRALDSQTMRHTTDHENMVRSEFSLPVPLNLVPSYLPHCSIMDIQYTIKVTIRFRHLGGELTVRLPITIAPATDQDDSAENTQLPVLNKPIMQFPYFSKSPNIPDANGLETVGRSSGRDSGRSTVRNHVHSNGTLRSHHGPVVANGTTASKRATAHNKKQRDFERNDNVTTKYKPGLSCCGCWVACMGYGIYES